MEDSIENHPLYSLCDTVIELKEIDPNKERDRFRKEIWKIIKKRIESGGIKEADHIIMSLSMLLSDTISHTVLPNDFSLVTKTINKYLKKSLKAGKGKS